jgi:hypothetical protein
MTKGRFTIARLLAAICLLGIVLAGLRSGSNDWFKLIYTLTFMTLVYAAIVARYRDTFWYGFAVAGWAYFVVGFGPWIGSIRMMFQDMLRANRDGICHCALTGAFAIVGGLVAGTVARRRTPGHGCSLAKKAAAFF